ncbi:hypothetical protein ACYX8G_19300 [Microbacterium saperdae]
MSESTESKSLNVETARAAVLASGELEAFEGPYFRTGRVGDWDSVFLADADHTHPDFARVIVTRRGQAAREIAIGWADYAEIIEGDDEARNAAEREWVGTRGRKPMAIFGAEAERHAYRVVFADVLAPLLGRAAAPAAAAAAVGGAPARDFAAEIAAAKTPAQIGAIDNAIRAVRGYTADKSGTDLHLLWKNRRREILAAAAEPAAESTPDAWAPVDHVERPTGETAPRAVPRDHLPPQNRAGRRAAARKKGGRR